MAKTTNFLFFLYFIQHARTGRLIGLFVLSFCLFFSLSFLFFCLFFFYLFFSFFSFFSLFTKSSFDSPGISVSKKVQLLMPSYTSFSDMEFISAGHSSGCSFQRFLCCSMIPRAMLACTRRGRGFRLHAHFYMSDRQLEKLAAVSQSIDNVKQRNITD